MLLRRLAALLCLLAGSLSAWAQSAVAAPEAGGVLVVPIHGTIDEGMAHLVVRAVAQAKAEHARAIVLDVDTYGGLVIAGTEIRDALLHSEVPVDAFVSRATSAGALVTLAASHIVMAPGSTFGDAQPIPKTEKTVSFLRAEFESTAQVRHRDARLAKAMVDARIDVPAYKPPNAILNLSADAARAAGFSEGTVPTLAAAFAHFGLGNVPRTEASYTFAEQIARIATSPEISGILLTLGFLGLLIELQTLHGVAGAIGAGSLALFFGTHIYAGFSNGLILALALVGVLLILFELHVLPGHGIAMTLGVLILAASILLAFGGLEFIVGGLQALAIAIVLSAVTFALLQRVLPENAFVKRLTFAGTQGPDYVASADHRHLLGASGTALSFLRPAGVATVDGVRVDVLTEGEFVPAGTPVRVTRVEGARIFVRALAEPGGSGVA
ncbi:MAG: ATP-dependent Clp protease proteolytic subunit [Candidatus Eremiobacteraeota bacterium]|nr:ATP-dependent Clp protease proteolytic subunit [Candidatus Eremiobacteraeota bacterium]